MFHCLAWAATKLQFSPMACGTSQIEVNPTQSARRWVTLYILTFVHFSLPFRYERKLRAATTLSFGNQAEAILSKRELVPNTNRHALEGSNPVWMSAVGYDNYNYKGADLDEDDDDEDEGLPNSHDNDDDMVERRNNLNGVVSNGVRRNHLESLDSLDANVLNDTYIGASVGGGGGEFEERSNGGSTIRMSSSHANGGKMANSTRSSSSGLGSGTARSRLSKMGAGIYSKNMTISALFPSQMPPVEKLNSVGKTVYDDDDVPRTEL